MFNGMLYLYIQVCFYRVFPKIFNGTADPILINSIYFQNVHLYAQIHHGTGHVWKLEK